MSGSGTSAEAITLLEEQSPWYFPNFTLLKEVLVPRERGEPGISLHCVVPVVDPGFPMGTKGTTNLLQFKISTQLLVLKFLWRWRL